MNKQLYQLLAIALIASSSLIAGNPFKKRDTYGKPFFSSRSQGDNLARRLAGEINELVPNCCGMHGVLSVATEYTESFDRDSLGQYFSFRAPAFDDCNCCNDFKNTDSNVMIFRGTSFLCSDTTLPEDVVADNFLLSSTFEGLIELRPKITNVIVDINWRMNLYGITQGLFLDVGIPVVWTRAKMGLRENTGPQPGLFSIVAADDATLPYSIPAPVNTIINAWRGQTEGTFPFTSATPGTTPIDIEIEQMRYAKINGTQKKHGIADVHVAIGRNFLETDESHVGVSLRFIVPTGTKPSAEYVFEPIVGNGHHFGLGGGMSAHTQLWRDECYDHSINIWTEGTIYHLFNAKQVRTFDLKTTGTLCNPDRQTNRVGSRYLLFKQFDTAGNFANRLVPGPNVTTLPADVRINVMGEFVVIFDYQWSNFIFDIGYNMWGRSGETIKITGTIPEDRYGILGGTPIDNSVAEPTAANSTNSQAQINGIGYSCIGGPETLVFVRTRDLDPKAAQAPSAFSNKVFAHVGYTFEGCYYSPFFGMGAEVEFSGIRNNALDQWGVWGKVGFGFS